MGTHWGLFRHYWVLIKFLLTVVSIAVLLMHQFTAISEAAKLVSELPAGPPPTTGLRPIGFVLLRASGLGVLVLLMITTISVYKPWGRVPYGQREQLQRRNPGLRVWVAAAVVLAVMVLVSAHLTGIHHSH